MSNLTNEEKWDALCVDVTQRYPVLASVWNGCLPRYGSEWLEDCIFSIEKVYGEITDPLPSAIIELVDSYAEFANDSMRNQVYFERTGKYRASNYEEVRQACYFNEEHMNRRYLPGMLLSHFLWPQHFHMLKGFKQLILPRVKNAKLFYEVGVGCGIYSKSTLEAINKIHGVGFDISQYSLDYTANVLISFNLRHRYHLENMDIKTGYSTKCDFLICQEVLEHLENPDEFCLWLANLIRPGGHGYITAALNAAHSDHIFLFQTPSELEDMVRGAGLQPLHMHEECALGYKERHLTPSLCGIFCEKPL